MKMPQIPNPLNLLKKDKTAKTAKSQANLEATRHTLAHLLAASVLELFPGSENSIGPAIENGFYQDFEIQGDLSDKDLPKIESLMRKKIAEWTGFEKGEMLFLDLCRGGHVENPSKDIDPEAFKLSHIAGAYWRGDEKNKMLTRIYGLAFASKAELEAYEKMQERSEERDHKKIGRELGLFVFSDVVGKGLPLWTQKGATVRRILERFIIDEEIRRGYTHVITPDIANLELYKKSGHYPYYKESMYAPITIDDE